MVKTRKLFLIGGVLIFLFVVTILMIVFFNSNNDNSTKLDYCPIIRRLSNDVNSNWGLKAIKINNNIKNITSSNMIIIAVIDTGINLKSNRIIKGYNAIDNSNDITDNNGHGTNISSIILNIYPGYYILPIKVIDKSGEQNPKILANAIEWAITNGANVINISLGMPNENNDVEREISKAIKKNIAVVCSAGNSSNYTLSFPAKMSSVISVVARDINNVDVGFSNRANKKSFSAPGVHIKIIDNNFVSGTSYASAFVTGVVSIMKSIDINIKLETIKEILKETSVDGNYFSYGLIQADKAILKLKEINTSLSFVSNNFIKCHSATICIMF